MLDDLGFDHGGSADEFATHLADNRTIKIKDYLRRKAAVLYLLQMARNRLVVTGH